MRDLFLSIVFMFQIQNTDEVKVWSKRGVDMPFNTNNVDVTVAANAVFGITSSVLNGIVPSTVFDDSEIRVSFGYFFSFSRK